jgi:ribonucleotide monophosphatase NagD (HAD superfamily)
MPMENVLSADMCAAGKPEAAVYKMALEKVGADKEGAGEYLVSYISASSTSRASP